MDKIYSIALYQALSGATFKEHKPLTAEEAAILDYTLGLPGEVGEVAEIIKHHVFHAEPLTDDVKLKLAKELGDIEWYVSAVAKLFNLPMEVILALNYAKLHHRHGNSFSFSSSAERHERELKFEETEEYKALKVALLEGIKEREGTLDV